MLIVCWPQLSFATIRTLYLPFFRGALMATVTVPTRAPLLRVCTAWPWWVTTTVTAAVELSDRLSLNRCLRLTFPGDLTEAIGFAKPVVKLWSLPPAAPLVLLASSLK